MMMKCFPSNEVDGPSIEYVDSALVYWDVSLVVMYMSLSGHVFKIIWVVYSLIRDVLKGEKAYYK